ncbi:MAG: MBL fold metallo-hydrolase RNA specificity domain-containing protein [Thermoplasmata archaeon]
MRIFYNKGVRVQDGGKDVVLDPTRRLPDSVVSHGHLDHLSLGALMTVETMDIMRVRLGREEGLGVRYGEEVEVNGLTVSLFDAGHVFGSAMIRVEDALYSGDFNPHGGPTCGTCEPRDCRYLILESTYGKPSLSFPPKEDVLSDILNWLEVSLESGPVVLGAYEFGKAQELMAVANKLDYPVLVDDRIADLADVYNRHGHHLQYSRYREALEEKSGPYVLILPTKKLRRPGSPELREALENGGKSAFASGWCSIYDLSRSHLLDAQFPLSDHADFSDLLWFVDECNPKVVYTCHGYAQELARKIRSRLRKRAEPLAKGWF